MTANQIERVAARAKREEHLLAFVAKRFPSVAGTARLASAIAVIVVIVVIVALASSG